MKIISVAVLSLVGAVSMTDLAVAQSNSWNLSRDMMTSISTNPTTPTSPATGVWSFEENMTGIINPVSATSYTLLTTYDPNCGIGTWTPPTLECWYNPSTSALTSVSRTDTTNFNNGFSNFDLIQGMPALHPSNNSQTIIGWKSPIKGTVRILGRITDLDSACGDGIQWRINKTQSPTNPTLVNLTAWQTIQNPASGLIPSGQTFSVSTSVAIGTKLYFVVDKQSDYLCDSTSLDLHIAKK